MSFYNTPKALKDILQEIRIQTKIQTAILLVL